MHWRILKKYFGKPYSKQISVVEYSDNGCVVRVSSQVRVEQAIMTEKSKHFILVYSSLLLCRDMLEKIGQLGKEVAS